MSKTRITVLISGNGSNLQALIDDEDQKLTDTTIIRVISNRKGAFGLTRAENAGIPTAYHNLLSYKRKHDGQDQRAREEYDADLSDLILKDEPDLVVCAGFMHVLSPRFLEPLEQKKIAIINLHPGAYFDSAILCLYLILLTALRGQYNGANAIERAHKDFMEDKITQTGVMIHYVCPGRISRIFELS
jgi:phosphoribosylglycinamide formyltransferase